MGKTYLDKKIRHYIHIFMRDTDNLNIALANEVKNNMFSFRKTVKALTYVGTMFADMRAISEQVKAPF